MSYIYIRLSHCEFIQTHNSYAADVCSYEQCGIVCIHPCVSYISIQAYDMHNATSCDLNARERERERERESERGRTRESECERDRQRERDIYIETNKEGERETARERAKYIY